MRILLATEPGSGGVGRHVIDLTTGLVQRGHDVDLVYSPHRADPWFLEAIHALPINVYAVDMEPSIGIRDCLAAFRLHGVAVKAGRYDVLHGHSSKAGALLRIAAAGAAAKMIYTPHALITLDPDLGTTMRVVYSIAERWLSHLADVIICVSEEEQRHAIELGISPDKLVVINNGLAVLTEPRRCAVRREYGIDETDICLGFVGRLASQKAVDRLIEAFASAYREDSRLRLVIAGSGPECASLRTLARSRGIDSRTTFVTNASGPYLMAGFDIFVMTSRYEAFPYVLLEAAARGLPIITTRVGGSDEIVKHGHNGFVLEQGASEHFAEQIGALCKRPRLRREMGKRSAEIARAFTIDRMVEQTIAGYRPLQDAAFEA